MDIDRIVSLESPPDSQALSTALLQREPCFLDEQAVAGKRVLSHEEKKARGLLYDMSKATAVRAESDGEDDREADFGGGDPFDTVAATKDVDWNADKIARKLASMPDIDPTLDIAAMRAKAQGAKMSEEEKKERGLLYDTSKASALRESDSEDDEGAADFEGGFDWD